MSLRKKSGNLSYAPRISVFKKISTYEVFSLFQHPPILNDRFKINVTYLSFCTNLSTNFQVTFYPLHNRRVAV